MILFRFGSFRSARNERGGGEEVERRKREDGRKEEAESKKKKKKTKEKTPPTTFSYFSTVPDQPHIVRPIGKQSHSRHRENLLHARDTNLFSNELHTRYTFFHLR